MTVWSERLLVAALAWGALAFGAVYPWAYWPLAVVCAAVGIHAIVVTKAWSDARTRTLALALGAVAAAIAVQLVALPRWALERLSPGVESFLREYQVFYLPASVHPLSIAPSQTTVALALFFAFGVLLVGLTRAIRYMSVEWLLNQIMGLGVALALVGILQKIVINPDHPALYGFWRPLQVSNPFGPFINRNHFAGWMVMALPVVAGFSCAVFVRTHRPGSPGWAPWLRWLTTVEASRFVLIAFSALFMGMALVLTGSRSGMASVAVATLAFAYLAMRRVHTRAARVMVIGYVTLILGGAVVWAGTDVTVGRFRVAGDDAPGRLLAWTDTRHIISDFPVFGTGIGTYGNAMLVYQSFGRPTMYLQAHNDYLQLVAEGGALVAVPAVLAGILIVVTIRRRLLQAADHPAGYWIRVGAVAGLLGIAAQSAVEFSLQMPGNRVLFVTLLALALHRAPDVSRQARKSSARQPSERHAHRV
ncbi:MAG TPA: O-antigen ligase family protein [Vicinamibacterales bacterium]|nr:O-antigen ligase family protein [Vicinamibacterales bacterium]